MPQRPRLYNKATPIHLKDFLWYISGARMELDHGFHQPRKAAELMWNPYCAMYHVHTQEVPATAHPMGSRGNTDLNGTGEVTKAATRTHGGGVGTGAETAKSCRTHRSKGCRTSRRSEEPTELASKQECLKVGICTLHHCCTLIHILIFTHILTLTLTHTL